MRGVAAHADEALAVTGEHRRVEHHAAVHRHDDLELAIAHRIGERFGKMGIGVDVLDLVQDGPVVGLARAAMQGS